MKILPGLACLVLACAALPVLAAPMIFTAKTARAHVGQAVTVRGTVQRVQHSGTRTLVYLDGHNARTAFIAVIGAQAAVLFPDVDTLAGRTVDVTGTVQLDNGAPVIQVTLKDQLTQK